MASNATDPTTRSDKGISRKNQSFEPERPEVGRCKNPQNARHWPALLAQKASAIKSRQILAHDRGQALLGGLGHELRIGNERMRQRRAALAATFDAQLFDRFAQDPLRVF